MTIYWALAIVAICGDIWIVASIWERVQTRRMDAARAASERSHELQLKALPGPTGEVTAAEVDALRAGLAEVRADIQTLSNRAELAKGGRR